MTAAETHAVPAPPGRVRRWLRAPLLHFVVLGGALFAFQRCGPGPDVLHHVRLTASDVAMLEEGWAQRTGRPPDETERAALIRAEVDDRLVLAEAFARGWNHEDPIVQRRLIQNQRFLAPDDPADDAELLERAYAQGMDRSDIVVRRRLLERFRLAVHAAARQRAPTRAELEAHWEANREQYARPERVRLTHVFLSRDRRRSSLERDAAALGERLAREAIPPEDAVRLGDPLLVRSALPLLSEDAIGRQLGAEFAAGAMAAPDGRWSGPVSLGLRAPPRLRARARAARRAPPRRDRARGPHRGDARARAGRPCATSCGVCGSARSWTSKRRRRGKATHQLGRNGPADAAEVRQSRTAARKPVRNGPADAARLR